MGSRPDNRRGPFGVAPVRASRRPAQRLPLHPAAAPAAANPFALLTPAQIQQQVAARTAGLPPVLTEQQLAARAQGEVDPLIAAISARINARAQAGAGAISGYTKQLASDLGQYAPQAANIYGQAQQAQAGTDAALSQMLSGQGNDLAANLSAKLGAAGMPQTVIDKTTGDAKTVGTGSAGALYGTGSAALSNLISQGASAQDYASKLPGIAGLGGLQSMRALEQQSQSQLADQSAQVEQQLPTILSSLRTGNQQAQADRATTANSIWDSLMGRNERIATGNRSRADTLAANRQARADALSLGTARNATTIAAANTRAAATIAEANQRNQTTIALADGRNRTAISLAKVKADQQAANDAKPNATLSKGLGYLVDSTGNYIPDKNGNPRVLPGFKVQNGQIVKTGTPKVPKTATPKTLTPKQRQDYMGTAATIADNAQSGFTDAKGVAHPAISAAGALKEMRQEGVPDTIAIQAINRAYGTNFNPRGKLP